MSSIVKYTPGIIRDTHAYFTKEDPNGDIKRNLISRVERAALIGLTVGSAYLASFAIGPIVATKILCISLLVLSPQSFMMMGGAFLGFATVAAVANGVGTASLASFGACLVAFGMAAASFFMEDQFDREKTPGLINFFNVTNPFTGRAAFQRVKV